MSRQRLLFTPPKAETAEVYRVDIEKKMPTLPPPHGIGEKYNQNQRVLDDL
jgi:hypothetical protein